MMIARKFAIGAVLIVSASLIPLAVSAQGRAKHDGVGAPQRQTAPPIVRAPRQQTVPPTAGKKSAPKTTRARPIDHCIPVSACTCQWEILDGKRVYVCTPRKIKR